MPRRHVRIATAAGLHARPASLVSARAAAGGHPITIGRVGQPAVDAASVIMLMGLDLQHGEDVELLSEDPAADAVLEEIAELLATDLDAAGVAQ